LKTLFQHLIFGLFSQICKSTVAFIHAGQRHYARHILSKPTAGDRNLPLAYPATAAPATAIVPPPRSFAPVSFAFS
jgi:hypothetical protein